MDAPIFPAGEDIAFVKDTAADDGDARVVDPNVYVTRRKLNGEGRVGVAPVPWVQ